jgi:hypothetical protein
VVKRMSNIDYGKAYTTDNSFRARAEERQRRYRADVLKIQAGTYGHLLTDDDAGKGRNFLLKEAHVAAERRRRAGKGVAERTFANMLSSQAMCFNIFAPLQSRLELAARVLRAWLPDILNVEVLTIEHTPARDIFGDQSGRGGVDCDLLIEGTMSGSEQFLVVIETKFVEREFSACGYRKPGRSRNNKAACPDDVQVELERSACLYTSRHPTPYTYWQRSDEHALLRPGAVPSSGCPFAGEAWQLWVNWCLAHEEAKRRGAKHVYFGVCAPSGNSTLLRYGKVLEDFKGLLTHSKHVIFIDLNKLIEEIANRGSADLSDWIDGLRSRYANI